MKKSKLDILVDALVVCPPDSPTRFVDNGDGTICDHETGLMWEKKVSDGVPPSALPDPNYVGNEYTWETVFTDFLHRLNGEVANSGASEQLGGYRDWRIPTIAELVTILDCNFSPCIDPIFGPTEDIYWSLTQQASRLGDRYVVNFSSGHIHDDYFPSISGVHARAVRGGR